MFFTLFLALWSPYTSEGFVDEYLRDNVTADNWTSCEQFLNNTDFEVDSVIDVDWQIFYYWSMHSERSYHVRFSAPSFVLIDRFRLELGKHIKPEVNWNESDLFMETSIDFSGLFIRTLVPGKFRFIPSMSFQVHNAPYLEIGLKVIDGYLGMLNCEQKVAYGLAPVERVPGPLEIEKQAAQFEIQNPFGRSYLTKNKDDPPPAALKVEDDYFQDDVHRNPITADIIF